MNYVMHMLSPEVLERYNLVLRLLLAAALGGMIGLEREHSGKPAGFRTNMLICLGAALLTEVSYIVAKQAHTDWGTNADPARIAAQVVSGIGFLGAGTILHNKGTVQGLTTAATLWVVAAIGMAVGARAYLAAMVGTGLVMMALMILGRFEDALIPRRPSDRNVNLTLRPPADVAIVEKAFVEAGFVVDTMSMQKNQDSIQLALHARGMGEKWEEAIHKLLVMEGIDRIDVM